MRANSVYKTLGEQLHINEIEIHHRKTLLEFTPQDEKLLTRALVLVEADIHSVIKKFYEKQTEVDEVSLIIGDADSLNRLRNTMKNYVRQLFSGNYDVNYANSRLRIGLVHKRIGVSPKYYLSALLLLKLDLNFLLEQHITDSNECTAVKIALDKLLMFDSQLVFDAYFRSMLLEVEIARDRAEKNELVLESMVTERTRKLEELVRKDNLTGLWNRRHFIEILTHEFNQAKQQASPLSLLYIDLDHFKNLNDTQGHSAGDKLLHHFAQELIGLCRANDTIARIGGDEFVILLPSLDIDDAMLVAKRVLSWDQQKHYPVSMSIGVISLGQHLSDTPENFLGLADAAMYQAKHNGGSQYVLASHHILQAEVSD